MDNLKLNEFVNRLVTALRQAQHVDTYVSKEALSDPFGRIEKDVVLVLKTDNSTLHCSYIYVPRFLMGVHDTPEISKIHFESTGRSYPKIQIIIDLNESRCSYRAKHFLQKEINISFTSGQIQKVGYEFREKIYQHVELMRERETSLQKLRKSKKDQAKKEEFEKQLGRTEKPPIL